MFSCEVTREELQKKNEKEGKEVVGVVLSGGPSSVYDPESPHVRPCIWKMIEEKSLPVLGICYGMQEMAHVFGGAVEPSLEREFGRAYVDITEENKVAANFLFDGVDHSQMWMSHGDKVTVMPKGFVKIAHTANCDNAAIANVSNKMFGLQFHPEVTHSVYGKRVLENFLTLCNAPRDWTMSNLADVFIENIRETVGPEGKVIGAVSGGVDSSVAAMLLHRAIGDRFHAILVDNGCLRKNEAKEVVVRLRERLGINLHVVNAADRFLSALDGLEEPEAKRKKIGNIFIDVFQEESSRIGEVDYLLQGTLYPDVIESISYKGPSSTIKTHHNVGGLPESMKLQLIEPLRELFKDEVRNLGLVLGIDEESINRHPFPGPGLAIRILGPVSAEKVAILQEADAILIEELHNANVYKDIAQAFVVLLPVKSVGVMGDYRTYEQVATIRCVTTTDFMTADFYHMDYHLLGKISSRIINEVRGINRVCYDVSSKPPATIEWE